MSKFIVIEGLEGAGKSSAVRYVTDYLQRHGINRIECTREPGGTPLAERMRAIVKEVHDERLTIEAELLLMYASRVQLVETRIKPALADGVWVVGIATISLPRPIRVAAVVSMLSLSVPSSRRCSATSSRISPSISISIPPLACSARAIAASWIASNWSN